MTNTPQNVILRTGDLFATEFPAIGHGVNVDGLMGAGVAAVVRARFPHVHSVYVQACLNRKLQPGQMLPIQEGPEGPWLLNLASQDRPGRNARLEWFEQSLTQCFRFAEFKHLNGFAIPRIGAGIGGLEWDDVFEVIKHVAADFPLITVEVVSL